jgi:hypothetical protein
VDPVVLAVSFLVVMAAAVACFWRAAWLRFRDPRGHVRWAVAGAAIDVAGTACVIVTSRVLGWHVPAASETVAAVHRGFAYVATAMLLFQAASGIGRWRVHGASGAVFLAVYTVTYALAVVAYAPWAR